MRFVADQINDFGAASVEGGNFVISDIEFGLLLAEQMSNVILDSESSNRPIDAELLLNQALHNCLPCAEAENAVARQ